MQKGRRKHWEFIERCKDQAFEKNLSPTNEIIRSPKKNNRGNSAESLKNVIPTIVVPSAPIPVQTAYAVPKGIIFIPRFKKYKLIQLQTKNKTEGIGLVNP